LADERLRISSAHIATFGERVVDVFYVKDTFGLKLTHASRIDRLKVRLIAAASGTVSAS
jgi:[protein-PII] uridylyltransferase